MFVDFQYRHDYLPIVGHHRQLCTAGPAWAEVIEIMWAGFSRIWGSAEYLILSASAAELAPQDEAPLGVTFRYLSLADLSWINQDRSGYGRTAQTYLNAGHGGVAAFKGDELVGMAWFRVNGSDKAMRVKGYFPLAPGECFFHADWTAPDHRRRGYHRALLVERVKCVVRDYGDLRLIANIEPDNHGSLQSYHQLGFEEEGRMRVVRVWRWFLVKVADGVIA